MKIPFDTYYKKLVACFMGKSIGGTLGMPYEGEERLLELTYYDPVPTGMVANDDLDLQIVWLEQVRRHGLPVNRRYLADAWDENLRCMCDEYGVAQRNIRQKLMPPASGAYDNNFYAGMGAAIRTELWACLCPGDPALAAELAREDACVDHVDDGVEAACFLAAVESAAFVEHDRDRLLRIGYGFIHPDGRLYHALSDTVHWWGETHDFVAVRQRILDRYYVQNWTDVSINLAFIVLGWLAGDGDFGKALCTAVNCGNDTDCTGATLGALLGILDPDGIDEKWTRPIGNDLVLSPGMSGIHEAATIDDMCEQIAALSLEIQRYYRSSVETVGAPAFSRTACRIAPPWRETPEGTLLSSHYDRRESVVALTPVYAVLRHPEGIALPMGGSGTYELELLGTQEAEAYRVTLRLPDGWEVTPAAFDVTLSPAVPVRVSFTIKAPADGKNVYINPLDIRLEGRSGRIDLTAGLMTAIGWWRVPDTPQAEPERVAVAGHTQQVPAGRYRYVAQFKAPSRIEDAILVAEGTRALRVWLDGRLVAESDGRYFVPAAHRGPARTRVELRPDWHEVCLEVPHAATEGEIFFGLFKPFGHEWIEDIEWRLPERSAVYTQTTREHAATRI